jgi:hypothetical protein
LAGDDEDNDSGIISGDDDDDANANANGDDDDEWMNSVD